MRRLPRPDHIDADGALRKIIQRKRGERRAALAEIEGSVREAGVDFDGRVRQEQLDGLRAIGLDSAAQDAMRHCYESNTKERDGLLGTLKEAVFGELQEWCAYCGSREELTWDHYASQDEFAELSVHPRNLIRACFPCNHSKGSRFRAMNGGRRVMHPYSDTVPAIPYLCVQLCPGPSLPIPEYRLDPKLLSTVEHERLHRHYDAFRLWTVYRKRAIERIGEVVGTYRQMSKPTSRGQIQRRLAAEARAFEQSYHLNDWRSALFRSLASSQSFIDLCAKAPGSQP